MKSERRHELQQNDLAIYLDRVNKAIEPYSRLILVVIGVVVVGGIAIAFYTTQQRELRSDATLQLIQAAGIQDAEVLVTVSEQFPETAAGAWARLYQGQQYLSQGIQSLYNDRNNAEELLGDAQAAFRTAIAKSDDPLLRSRAHFGIARAAESLGNLDEAITEYGEVVSVNESEAMVKKANDRIEALSNPQTKEFLAWFSDQDFSPADPSLPPSLPGSDALPDLPDLDLPDLTLSSDSDTKERNLDGGLELPDDAAMPENDGQPSDAKSSEAESAEESTPSESSDSADPETADADADASTDDAPADDK